MRRGETRQLLLPFGHPLYYPNGKEVGDQSVTLPQYTQGAIVRICDADAWEKYNGLTGEIVAVDMTGRVYTVALDRGGIVYLSGREFIQIGR